MNTRPVRKLLHFFDRKHLLQRRFRRFLALEKTHSVFRDYAELTDVLVSGRRLAGSIKALIKVNVQNTELDSFGFVVRKAPVAEPRHPMQQLSDFLRHEGQWLQIRPRDTEATVRSAINAVLDARSFHVHLHDRLMFPPDWTGLRVLDAIREAELEPAGFVLVPLGDAGSGFAGTVLRKGQERRVAELLEKIKPA